MTPLLLIPAAPDAPRACDLSAAEDNLGERLAEYRQLLDHALIDQQAADTSTTYRLADRPGVHEWVLDLAVRQAACCPFLSFEVTAAEDRHLLWHIGGLGAADAATLGEFPSTADRRASSEALARDLAAHGRVPIRLGR